MDEFSLRPDPDDPRLTRRVGGIDQTGSPVETAIVHERALTLFLNGQEIVTMMTISDHPQLLALGYLINQGMLRPDEPITAIDYDEDRARGESGTFSAIGQTAPDDERLERDRNS